MIAPQEPGAQSLTSTDSQSVCVIFGRADVAYADTEYHFQSPSGNIACMLADVLNGGVECDIADYIYAVPARPANCPLNFGDRFALSPGEAPLFPHPSCTGWSDRSRPDPLCGNHVRTRQGLAALFPHGDTVRVPGGMQTLNYGQTMSLGPISCNSEPAVMTCTDARTRHYFRVARDSYELH
jgi:hypothetical protein